MHKTIVMSQLSLQEWRPHICSQTERISKLVLEFSSTRSGCSVPFSEMAISRQTSTHWERSPPCALIHVQASQLLVKNSWNSTALFHFLCLTMEWTEMKQRQDNLCLWTHARLCWPKTLDACCSSMGRWNGNIWWSPVPGTAEILKHVKHRLQWLGWANSNALTSVC